MHEGQVIRRSLFITSGHPPELLQPVDAALRPTPLPVHLPVKPGWPAALAAFRLPLRSLVFSLGDHVPDATAAEHLPALRITVAFVQRRLIRYDDGAEAASLVALNDWVGKGGRVHMTERRGVTVRTFYSR